MLGDLPHGGAAPTGHGSRCGVFWQAELPGHQLPDGFEDDLEMLVVLAEFLFHFIEFGGEVFVGGIGAEFTGGATPPAPLAKGGSDARRGRC